MTDSAAYIKLQYEENGDARPQPSPTDVRGPTDDNEMLLCPWNGIMDIGNIACIL